MDEEKKRVGKRVEAYRQLAGWTQQELADAAGCHRNSIQAIESGRQMPGGKTLAGIARALKKSGDDITGAAPSLDPPETPAQLKGWMTDQLSIATRGMNVWMEQIIEAEVKQRLAKHLDDIERQKGIDEVRQLLQHLREEYVIESSPERTPAGK